MKKRYITLTIMLFIITTMISITPSFAWFVNKKEVKDRADRELSSNASYYGGGDGTSSNPFIISDARHLYNLAWLQDLGYYDGEDRKYFKMEKDIDMTSIGAIPPIGIDAHPFISSFEGNGKVINNAVIETDGNNFTVRPSDVILKEHLIDTLSSITNGKIITSNIGLFGKIHTTDDEKTQIKEGVTNFFINNAKINYRINDARVGIVAGYVDGNLNTVGVSKSSLEFASSLSITSGKEVVSKYTLVGDYNDNSSSGVQWDDNPGNSYGNSTNIKQLSEDLLKLNLSSGASTNSSGEVPKGYAFPFAAKSSDLVTPSSSKISMNLYVGKKDVDAAYTQEAKPNNIGYYIGADVKVYNKNYNYDGNYYLPKDSSNSELLVGDKVPTDKINKYVQENGSYMIRLTGTQQLDVQNEGGLVVVENGQVGDYKGKVLLPNRCIWVAPTKPGVLKFVLPAVEDKMGFRVIKLTRSTPKDYSSYFKDKSNSLEYNATLLKGKTYYFEIPVSQEDIDAGYEFAVNGGDNYKPYISYIDLGTTGGAGSTGNSGKAISNIDFVNLSSDAIVPFSENYTNTGVLFEITATGSKKVETFSFERTDKNTNTPNVKYSDDSTMQIKVKPIGETSNTSIK